MNYTVTFDLWKDYEVGEDRMTIEAVDAADAIDTVKKRIIAIAIKRGAEAEERREGITARIQGVKCRFDNFKAARNAEWLLLF